MKLQPVESLHLSIRPAANGLPTQSPEGLQDWISHAAKTAFVNSPPPPPPRLAPTVMDMVLKSQGK